MKLLVTGTRTCYSYSVGSTLDRIHKETPITLLIHGAASGVDTLAAKWAKSNGVETLSFPADWVNLGKAAGPIRNTQMLESGGAQKVLAIWDGRSRGTKDMIRKVEAKGLPMEVVMVQPMKKPIKQEVEDEQPSTDPVAGDDGVDTGQ